jgi:serine/threonine protein kinase
VIGDIPLHDDNILALYNKIKTQPVEFTDDQKLALSPEIRDLITRMLIKDPNQRITLNDIKVSS